MYEDPLTAFLDRWLSWGSKYPVARHQALTELRALVAAERADQRRQDVEWLAMRASEEENERQYALVAAAAALRTEGA